MAQPLSTESTPVSPPTSNTRARLSSFGWFIGGMLAVVIFLQIHAQVELSYPFFTRPLQTSKYTNPHRRPHHKPAHKKPVQIEIPASVAESPVVETPQGRTWDSFDQAFIFGDSYTSLGFKPDGEQPSHEDPFGNMRHGGPPNWVQYLTLTHNETFFRVYDFAVGGSTVDRALATPYLLGSTFIEELTGKFKRFYTGKKPRAKWDPEKTLFMSWFGVNDLFGTLGRPRPSTLVADIAERYEEIAEELYSNGARHMIFFTVPPFERSTQIPADRKVLLIADLTAFNARIFEMRDNLKRNHVDLDVAVFDAASLWSRVIDNPADFEETKTVKYPLGVCNSPPGKPRPFPEDNPHKAKCHQGLVEEYLWYGLHGTFPTHNVTARHIATNCFGLEGRSGFCS